MGQSIIKRERERERERERGWERKLVCQANCCVRECA